MLTYTPQPDNWKPLQPAGTPYTPDTITLRECFVWRHTTGDDKLYWFLCYEALPPHQGFLCVRAYSYTRPLGGRDTIDDFARKVLFDTLLAAYRLHPTIDEAIDAFGPDNAITR